MSFTGESRAVRFSSAAQAAFRSARVVLQMSVPPVVPSRSDPTYSDNPSAAIAGLVS